MSVFVLTLRAPPRRATVVHIRVAAPFFLFCFVLYYGLALNVLYNGPLKRTKGSLDPNCPQSSFLQAGSPGMQDKEEH